MIPPAIAWSLIEYNQITATLPVNHLEEAEKVRATSWIEDWSIRRGLIHEPL
jgi:hypothetical protein